MPATIPRLLSLPILQVAGVRDRAEADLLVRCGVRWLGFPLRLAVHAPDLSEIEATTVIGALPPDAMPVLITYLDFAPEIATLAAGLGARAVQLHGPVALAEVAELRRLLPELVVIKSLVVRGDNAGDLMGCVAEFAPLVDAFITDTFDPRTGACGATGLTHDWDVSRALVAASPRPVILAGGLTPENVAAAIAAVRPAGVDVHTGVEEVGGAKSAALVRAFVAAARGAFSALCRPA